MALTGKKDLKELGQEIVKPQESLGQAREAAPTPAAEKATAPVIEQAPVSETSGQDSEQAVFDKKISEIQAPVQSISAPIVKDEVVKEIEEIMSEDLTDLFLKMTPEQQKEFQAEGEETASKIRILLSSAKVKVKSILGLITAWLKLIPGVNKFFLEQEAKIKTDKILLSADDFRKEGKL